MNCTPAIITLALLIAADPAHSDDSAQPISGTYALGGATLMDPPANEAKNTHLRLYLTGNAARDLYAALPTPAVHDECLDDGSVTKAVAGRRAPGWRTLMSTNARLPSTSSDSASSLHRPAEDSQRSIARYFCVRAAGRVVSTEELPLR